MTTGAKFLKSCPDTYSLFARSTCHPNMCVVVVDTKAITELIKNVT